MESTIVQENQLMTVDEVAILIKDGRSLILSAEEDLLSQLPTGNWIGGSIPYFYLKGQNGRMDKTMIMVTDLTDSVIDFKVTTYTEDNLKEVCSNGFENGFNFIFLPALRPIHFSFAMNAANYEDQYQNPLIGSIAGVDLDEFGAGRLSKTFNGSTGESYTDEAVVLHAKLAPNKVARTEIVNVFEQDTSFTLEVHEDGFTVGDCTINGEKGNLYDFVKKTEMDISRPITVNKGGAIINVSFQSLDDEKREVVFYAPLFKGETYHHSKTDGSYAGCFKNKVTEVMKGEKSVIYNCNCILNYLYGELDKNEIGFSGAATFGEIGYTLLNQTFTYLAIDEA